VLLKNEYITVYVPHLHAESALAVVFFNPRAMLCLASLSVCFCAGCHLCFDIDIASTQPSL
jgi:hypothetical protein